ncbi:MAG: hypothetical protein V4492_03460, partial [Chlamydiota bacterium]
MPNFEILVGSSEPISSPPGNIAMRCSNNTLSTQYLGESVRSCPSKAEAHSHDESIIAAAYHSIQEIRRQKLPVQVTAKLFQWVLLLPITPYYLPPLNALHHFSSLVSGTFAFPGIIEKKIQVIHNLRALHSERKNKTGWKGTLNAAANVTQAGFSMSRSYCKAILNLEKTHILGIVKIPLKVSTGICKASSAFFLCAQAIKLSCDFVKLKQIHTVEGLSSKKIRERPLNIAKAALSSISAISLLWNLCIPSFVLLTCSSASIAISVYKKVQRDIGEEELRRA